MDTLNDYLNASPVEREAEKARRGWEAKPPTAHTHRDKPRAWEMGGHHEATKPKRTPTHRAEGNPVIKPEHQPLADLLGIRYA